jgi:hypothetical protein
LSIPNFTLLTGIVTPVAVPPEVMDALQRVEIVTEIGERGSFRLSFLLQENSKLPERFLLESADLVRVVMIVDEAAGPSVLMDGVMV